MLVVHSATGTTIDHRTLTTDDLMGGARIPQVILPGYAGPVWAPPALPQRPGAGTGTGGGATIPATGANSNAPPALAGTLALAGIGFLRHPLQPMNAVLHLGSTAAARLAGTDRHDKILGRAGNERIEGRGGAQSLFRAGGAGHPLWRRPARPAVRRQRQRHPARWRGRRPAVRRCQLRYPRRRRGRRRPVGRDRGGYLRLCRGAHRITDFDTGQDRLSLGSDLWNGNLIPGDALFLHPHLAGSDTVLDFGTATR